MINKKHILIIGAGPAGMACALKLYQAEKSFIVIEKDKQVGGLAKTYEFGEFKTDNGPHRFFSQNPELYDFIRNLLGRQWIKVNRSTRFYVKNKFYKYPIELKDVILKINVFQALKMLRDYFLAKILFFRKKPKNFEEHIIDLFGKSLAEFNILKFSAKIWGLPCTELSADWATQRIKGLTIKNILKYMIFKKDGPKTLVQQFYYPETGTGLIYEKIKAKIENKNQILLKTQPIKIFHNHNKIQKVILSNNTSYNPSYLISSMPITALVKLFQPLPPNHTLEAVQNLKYRSQVYLFLTINKELVSKDQWIYFPDKEIPFARISEMKNFSLKMSPKYKTSLFIEFFCDYGDKIWNSSKQELTGITIKWLEKLSFVKKNEILNVFHFKQKNAYPVYDLNYKDHLNIIKKYLNQFQNLIYIGRSGRFKYTNQDHSLEMGILAAKSIIQNKKYDIEKIGNEQKYLESGQIN
ncbi:MAG: FAD-dependent oxidoreductase [Candidatus Pacebacteria bacterium]|nr:FAD-dependent oxidoreductase [Candidatus Paceibacterota bacterium]